MAIAGSSGLLVAQTIFEAAYQSAINGAASSGVPALIAQDIAAPGANRVSIPVVTSLPRLREWIGSRVAKDLRAFRQDVDVKTYEATVPIKRRDIDGDASGAVAAALIGSFPQRLQAMLEDVCVATLIANAATGYDGVSLLNAAHPFSSGTGNNITTDALGFASYRAAKQAMRLFADEDGTPLNMSPTHLLVGPAAERAALEVVGADRPVPYSATAQDATASILAATSITNVYQGECQVVVSPWITGNQWFLMDLSKPGIRPLVRAVHRELEPVSTVEDGMTHYVRFVYDEYHFGVEGDFAYAPGVWQTIYGRVAA